VFVSRNQLPDDSITSTTTRGINGAKGEQQAERYITGLFEAFDGIESGRTLSGPIPAEFAIEGCFFRYQRHFVYWRRLSDGDIGIVTILHERMHQLDRLREEFRI